VLHQQLRLRQLLPNLLRLQLARQPSRLRLMHNKKLQNFKRQPTWQSVTLGLRQAQKRNR
jgi:hypothetical protein